MNIELDPLPSEFIIDDDGDFNLVGTILEVYGETILFETDQKTSYLDFDSIITMVPLEEEY